MGEGSKHNSPVLDYFLGKPMHKINSRGVQFVPIYVNGSCSDPLPNSRRSSRASQQPSERAVRGRCETHSDHSRPSTPSGSECSNCNSARKYCGGCFVKGADFESFRRKKKRQCSHGQKPLQPTGLQHQGFSSSTSSSTKVATPLSHFHHYPPMSSLQGMTNCSQDRVSDCLHPAHMPAGSCAHQPVEISRDNATPAKCTCRPSTSPPEMETRSHCCCHSEDCRFDNSSYFTLDDSVSESSVDVSPGGEKSANECPFAPQYCYHPVYVAISCGTSGMD